VYIHPPITEAVVGINFVETLDEDTKSSLTKKLSAHYAVHQPIENLSVSVDLSATKGSQQTANTQVSKETSHRFGSSDMTELALVFPKSFVVSQMAPYPGWEPFFERFTRDWKLVRRALGFREIARIGVRFINRIDIPIEGPIVEHEKYLNIYPHVSDKYGALSAYAVQAQIFMDDMRCKLLLNSASIPSPLLNTASFLIDIDISRDIEVPQKDEDILNLVSSIRPRKNDVFESCVTDLSRGLFKHDT